MPYAPHCLPPSPSRAGAVPRGSSSTAAEPHYWSSTYPSIPGPSQGRGCATASCKTPAGRTIPHLYHPATHLLHGYCHLPSSWTTHMASTWTGPAGTHGHGLTMFRHTPRTTAVILDRRRDWAAHTRSLPSVGPAAPVRFVGYYPASGVTATIWRHPLAKIQHSLLFPTYRTGVDADHRCRVHTAATQAEGSSNQALLPHFIPAILHGSITTGIVLHHSGYPVNMNSSAYLPIASSAWEDGRWCRADWRAGMAPGRCRGMVPGGRPFRRLHYHQHPWRPGVGDEHLPSSPLRHTPTTTLPPALPWWAFNLPPSPFRGRGREHSTIPPPGGDGRATALDWAVRRSMTPLRGGRPG